MNDDRKSIILRLDSDMMFELEVVASVLEMKKNEVIEDAISEYLEKQFADPDFRNRFKKYMERLKVMSECHLDM